MFGMDTAFIGNDVPSSSFMVVMSSESILSDFTGSSGFPDASLSVLPPAAFVDGDDDLRKPGGRSLGGGANFGEPYPPIAGVGVIQGGIWPRGVPATAAAAACSARLAAAWVAFAAARAAAITASGPLEVSNDGYGAAGPLLPGEYILQKNGALHKAPETQALKLLRT